MKAGKGFTLIELLVVIGIIAILMALLLPGIEAAKTQAKKARARAEVKQIETAWKNLLMDSPTRKWPAAALGSDEMRYDQVMCLLSNNPARLSYLEINKKSMFLSKSGGNPRDGGMKDPWSTDSDPRLYRIVFDTSYSNRIDIVRGTGTKKTNEVVLRTVAVWSDGPKRDDPEDDILGW